MESFDLLLPEVGTMLQHLDEKIVECRLAQEESFLMLVKELDQVPRFEAVEQYFNETRTRFLAKLKRSLADKLEECKRRLDLEKEKAKTKSHFDETVPRTESGNVQRTLEELEDEQRISEGIELMIYWRYGILGHQDDHLVGSIQEQYKMKFFLMRNLDLISFEPKLSDAEPFNIGCFVDLVYKNSFSIEQKIDYMDIYQSQWSMKLDFLKFADIDNIQPWMIMPISRNRLVFSQRNTFTLSIIDSKCRVLLKRNAKGSRKYVNIKVYGRRVVATGLITCHRPPRIFLDVYDLNLRLTATKIFGWTGQDYSLFIKLERVSQDIFMHRYTEGDLLFTGEGEHVYTLFDFKLYKIVEHRSRPTGYRYGDRFVPNGAESCSYEPFFYDGEKIENFTSRHLDLLIHSPYDIAESKKRLLNLYTGREIKWEHMQEANKIDGKYFDYKEKPQTFLVFNLDRDTFDYLSALNASDLKSNLANCNCVTVDERYKGGVTENGDLFFKIKKTPGFTFA